MSASEIEQILNDPVKFKALAKAAFDTVDTDNSGFIDETELKQAMIQVSGEVGCHSPSDADVSQVMKELDADGNGKIDLQEFEVLIRQVLSLMNTQSVKTTTSVDCNSIKYSNDETLAFWRWKRICLNPRKNQRQISGA